MTPRDFSSWYERVHPELHHHGLWLRGGELNTLPPAEYAARPFRVLFARLSTYDDTGYSFTHQLLYQLGAQTCGVFPDLAYLPPRRDLAAFERDGVPWLLGTQSKRGPEGFDLVGFSNSIVQELANVPSFLEKSGIPLGKRARLADPAVPILLLGGANALYSSALWCDDPLVDAIFVGEDDAAIRRILELARDGKAAGLDKTAILESLESVDGVFQPDRPRRTKKSFVSNLNRGSALERGPVYYLPDALGSSHLQISEGCPCFCSFCAESWDRKPYRERNVARLREVALAAKAGMGLEEIDLYSFNFNMHSGFYQVLWDLVPLFRQIGLKSQRFDLLAHDPEMVEFQHAIQKASLTCGLEGISPRLRSYLHKNLETGELHASLRAIFGSRARALKVFLIATGLEEDQDFAALEDLIGHFAAVRNECRATTRLVFSMTPLVRFPWTPLEYEDAFEAPHYAAIIDRTAKLVRSAGFEFRESADLPEYWLSQVLVRAADPRVGEALVRAARETGFVYYRAVDEEFAEALRRALAELGLDPAALLRGHSFEEGERKPWTSIDTSVFREFLWQEVLRSRAYAEIDYCLGRAWTKAMCFQCGGCPTIEHVANIVKAKQERDYSLAAFQERLSEARASEREVEIAFEVGPSGRGVPRKLAAVALARALMLADSELASAYRGFVKSHWGGDGTQDVWFDGDDLVTLRFAKHGAERLRELAQDGDFRARTDAELGSWGRFQGLAGDESREWTFSIRSPFPFAAERWFGDEALTFTLRRAGEGAYVYEWSAKAVKRDVLRALRVEKRDAGVEVTLVAGRRFEPATFLRQAFRTPRKSDWVRIRTRCTSSTAVGVATPAQSRG